MIITLLQMFFLSKSNWLKPMLNNTIVCINSIYISLVWQRSNAWYILMNPEIHIIIEIDLKLAKWVALMVIWSEQFSSPSFNTTITIPTQTFETENTVTTTIGFDSIVTGRWEWLEKGDLMCIRLSHERRVIYGRFSLRIMRLGLSYMLMCRRALNKIIPRSLNTSETHQWL